MAGSSLTHHFRFMAAYHQDCTRRLLEAVTTYLSGDLPTDHYRSDTGLYFRSIHGTLAHLLGGDQIWFERITETPRPDLMKTILPIYELDPPAIGSAWERRSPDRSTLFDALEDQCNQWVDLLEDKDDAWTNAPLRYSDSWGNPTTIVRAAGLSQVFNHGTHHRGQISSTFAGLGMPSRCPSFDLQSLGTRFKTYSHCNRGGSGAEGDY